MGEGRGSGSAILVLAAAVFCAVMYYAFHIVSFGWILKAIVAVVILFVLFCVGACAWVIWDAVKQRKEQERKEAERRKEEGLQEFDKEK